MFHCGLCYAQPNLLPPTAQKPVEAKDRRHAQQSPIPVGGYPSSHLPARRWQQPPCFRRRRTRRASLQGGRRGIRLRLPARPHGRDETGDDQRTIAHPDGGSRQSVRTRTELPRPRLQERGEPQRRHTLLGRLARCLEGAHRPPRPQHERALLPDADARRLDQRLRLAGETNDRHG